MMMDWKQFLGHTLTITLYGNFGVIHGKKKDDPDIYETIIKTGTLIDAFDDGLLLEGIRNNQLIKIFISIEAIKLVEIH